MTLHSIGILDLAQDKLGLRQGCQGGGLIGAPAKALSVSLSGHSLADSADSAPARCFLNQFGRRLSSAC
jgi:hypothetical protein